MEKGCPQPKDAFTHPIPKFICFLHTSSTLPVENLMLTVKIDKNRYEHRFGYAHSPQVIHRFTQILHKGFTAYAQGYKIEETQVFMDGRFE